MMFKGIFLALTACFIWGLIFVIPQFMEGFTPVEIVLGRYFFYGVLSLILLLKNKKMRFRSYSLSIWMRASLFSLLITIAYYTLVLIGMRCATPAVCALVGGTAPISIAFYGNWRNRERSFQSLLIPSLLMMMGLLLINIPNVEMSDHPLHYFFGVLCSFLALLSWSWYMVANAEFLQRTQEVVPEEWSTLIGVTTLGWVGICSLTLAFLNGGRLDLYRYCVWEFFLGSAVMGLLCSWVAFSLWNKASIHLSISLAGQLLICETLFGLSFVYLVEGRMPPPLECLGALLLLGGVVYAIRQCRQVRSYDHRSSLSTSASAPLNFC